MSNGKKGLGRGQIGMHALQHRGFGSTISDADQKFIARMNKAVKDGSKSISDADQTRYKRLTGKNWPGGGKTKSDRDLGDPGPGATLRPRATPRQKRMRLGETPMEEIKRTSQEIRHGGPVKKYAKGGGVRKARYK